MHAGQKRAYLGETLRLPLFASDLVHLPTILMRIILGTSHGWREGIPAAHSSVVATAIRDRLIARTYTRAAFYN